MVSHIFYSRLIMQQNSICRFASLIFIANFLIRRASLRRGEHAGRLKQAILSGLLQPTDVIVGEFFIKYLQLLSDIA
jgi:hypothetical protein